MPMLLVSLLSGSCKGCPCKQINKKLFAHKQKMQQINNFLKSKQKVSLSEWPDRTKLMCCTADILFWYYKLSVHQLACKEQYAQGTKILKQPRKKVGN